ncbi:protein-export membrane protein SecF [Candidatus Peribacteria bacterium RIFCSPLOWO2_12_FULL_55_15]|nr:MAG: protein-export membrane protein SecF [Candidatus Peribacteria bacterium RIFCSPHIGHO2_01_FULL_54_22]OGJ62654.1 MAG: protein-export membrane protein SecF [Candidatus Peribacteria bacterium RIFCSPHIGHO2_02_FULL_55_24]OGJ70296.1 MAG: protein-export membrane protein SecF [Candidatus Peribacteria bacterium RIFCSPLOWO2_02_FULL_55_36]OGJ72285.1 MAG: protein-export membrane protein SecF [Candidatus Peribacteria bacterium RIFCSPLOWO2_12_FULL_55_15]
MSFIGASRVLLPCSLALAIGSCVLLLYPGPRLSVEFTGGTLMEIQLPDGKTKEDLATILPENTSITSTRNGSILIRSRVLGNEEHRAIGEQIEKQLGPSPELQFTTIGPTVGRSLRIRALWAIAVAAVAIIIYLAFAFRKITHRLSPWTFAISAMIATFHDTLITLGIFTIISRFTSFEMDLLFVAGLLSIIGYSVNDTIVVFDRIRDNIFLDTHREDFSALAEQSIRQTMTRTINTGTGVMIMLFALFFFGAESIRWFVLTLIVGTIIGTYSSFFVAIPLLVCRKEKS